MRYYQLQILVPVLEYLSFDLEVRSLAPLGIQYVDVSLYVYEEIRHVFYGPDLPFVLGLVLLL